MTTLDETRKMAIAVSKARARIELARRHEGALDGAAKTRNAEPFVGESLQDTNRTYQFGRIGRRVGERILGKPRAAAHGAAEGIERQHDDRYHREHEGRQVRARHHHHDARAEKQHEVAQRDRDRTADCGLDLRGVGGEPRDDFAGPRLIEEGSRQPRHVREHVAAQIGDDALAQAW